MKTIILTTDDACIAEAILKWFESGAAMMALTEDTAYYDATGETDAPYLVPRVYLEQCP